MMGLEEKKQEIIADFSLYDEWLDKYEYLIELGKNLQEYPEDKKTEDRLIKGCQSRVWLDWELRDGKLWFTADSDAVITRGIISLLISVYSGRTPAEIAADDFAFIDQLGLRENLSPTRANGLVSMIDTIRNAAKAAAHEQPEAAAGPSQEEILTAEDVKALAPMYESVVFTLKQIYDPEIPVNIYDLGLIYELNIDKTRRVHIRMTFTAPNCPMADEVIAEVQSGVESVPGVTGCDIELVFDPVWDRSMLSDEARVALGMEPEMDDYEG